MFFKDAIAPEENKVVIISYFKTFDIRSCNYAPWVTSITWIFGFNISDGSGDRQSTWEHSVWPNDHLHSCSIIRRRIRHITFILIDLATVFFHSFCFDLVLWLVIFWEKEDFLTSINGHDGPTVSNIGNIARIPYDKYNNGTCSTSLNKVLIRSALLMSPLQENLLSFWYSILNGYLWILWEILIPYYKLMKLIPKIICTRCSTMPIIDCKERAPGPFFNLFEFWFDYIQNNWNSIFIIVPDNSLMGIGWIAAHHSILFASKLCWVVGCYVPVDLVLLHFHVFLLLLKGHDEPSVSHKLVVTFRLLKAALFWLLGLWWALSIYFVMALRRWLWVTRFLSWLLSILLNLWPSSTSSRFLWIILRILSLVLTGWLCTLRSPWFVPHSWTCSQSIDTLILLRSLILLWRIICVL